LFPWLPCDICAFFAFLCPSPRSFTPTLFLQRRASGLRYLPVVFSHFFTTLPLLLRRFLPVFVLAFSPPPQFFFLRPFSPAPRFIHSATPWSYGLLAFNFFFFLFLFVFSFFGLLFLPVPVTPPTTRSGGFRPGRLSYFSIPYPFSPPLPFSIFSCSIFYYQVPPTTPTSRFFGIPIAPLPSQMRPFPRGSETPLGVSPLLLGNSLKQPLFSQSCPPKSPLGWPERLPFPSTSRLFFATVVPVPTLFLSPYSSLIIHPSFHAATPPEFINFHRPLYVLTPIACGRFCVGVGRSTPPLLNSL